MYFFCFVPNTYEHKLQSRNMCVEIIPHLWLGDRDDSARFQGTAIVSIGCNPYAEYSSKMNVQMRDSTDSRIEDYLEPALRYIHTTLCLGHDILVHCKSGVNRSPAFIFAYLTLFEEYSKNHAIALIKLKHPRAKLQHHYLEGIERYKNSTRSF